MARSVLASLGSLITAFAIVVVPAAHHSSVAAASAQTTSTDVTRLAGTAGDFYRPGQAPGGLTPSADDIERDLPYLSYLGNAVRLFGCQGHLQIAATILAQWGLIVIPGAWLSADSAANDAEVACLSEMVRQLGPDRIPFVVVGNEAVLRGDVSAATVVQYAHAVRDATGVKVTTAEPETTWLRYPELNDLDVRGLIVHPYWQGVDASQALGVVQQAYDSVSQIDPPMPTVILEVGWPHCGATNGAAVPSVDNMREVFIDLARWSYQSGVSMMWLEHRDMEWKAAVEGMDGVGACWGLSSADGGQPYVGAVSLRFPNGLPGPSQLISFPSVSASPIPVRSTSTPTLSATQAAGASPIAILMPNDGGVIRSSPTTVTGVVNPSRITAGNHLVVIVRDPLGQYWVQAPPSFDSDGSGKWKDTVYIGESRDTSASFPITALITATPFRMGAVLASLPQPVCPECQITITVTRG